VIALITAAAVHALRMRARCTDNGGSWVRVNCRSVEDQIFMTMDLGNGMVITTCTPVADHNWGSKATVRAARTHRRKCVGISAPADSAPTALRSSINPDGAGATGVRVQSISMHASQSSENSRGMSSGSDS
jgi:hypothetical protein